MKLTFCALHKLHPSKFKRRGCIVVYSNESGYSSVYQDMQVAPIQSRFEISCGSTTSHAKTNS